MWQLTGVREVYTVVVILRYVSPRLRHLPRSSGEVRKESHSVSRVSQAVSEVEWALGVSLCGDVVGASTG